MLLRSRLSEKQAPVWKIESGQATGARDFDAARAPVEPSSDHQMQHQPQIVVQPNGDAFADTSQDSDGFACGARKWRISRTQQKGTDQSDMLQRLAKDALFERFNVDDDV